MLVLGIDPGTATTGYGFVREQGGAWEALAYDVISTPANQDLPQRLQTIYHDVCALIDEYAPDAAAVEQVFFSRNVKTAISVAQARGVVLLAFAERGVPIAEYKPNEIKQAVAGYGNAPKSQMQIMVQNLLDLDDIPRPDDAADALAVAITHLNAARFRQMVEGS